MSTVRSPVRGLSCRRCGGALRAGAHPDLLRCTYCDTGHLVVEGSEVDARAPAGRLGRRRAQRVLRRTLRAHGVRGHAVESARLCWLPFWQVEAKLVGWQRYRRATEAATPTSPRPGRPSSPLAATSMVEETVARDVRLSLPACDVRSFGLVGIADRLRELPLRPFRIPEAAGEETAYSVALARSTALRRTELYHGARLAPRGAVDLRQRVSLVRPRLRLVYYPVWRLEYRVRGLPHECVVDGIRGRLLRGTATVPTRAETGAWLAVATGGGWLSGLSPVLTLVGWGGWLLHQGSRRGARGGWEDWAGWLGRQLDPRALRTIALEDPGPDPSEAETGGSDAVDRRPTPPSIQRKDLP